jgi:transcriptional regulator with XRE-family HTH domain
MLSERSFYQCSPGRYAAQNQEFRRLAAELKRLASKNSYSQERIAPELGVTAITVNHWLTGRSLTAERESIERLKTFLAAHCTRKPQEGASSASLIWNQNIQLSPHGRLSSVSDDMLEPKESNRSGNGFLVAGILATLGTSACCEGGLKFLCGSQPEIKIRDGSDQEEAMRAGLGMQERAH